jgi:hypothetical protein
MSSFFYHTIPEDKIAYELRLYGKLTENGKVASNESIDYFDDELLKLDELSIKKIKLIFDQALTLKGRCKDVPLEINFSMSQAALALYEASRKIFSQSLEIIFDGGALWKPIKPLIHRLFEIWCGEIGGDHLSPLFRFILDKANPNDYDWQCKVKGLASCEDNKKLINKGLVKLLAKKFKKRLINPHLLALELAKSKKRIEKRQTAPAYLSQVFKDHPHIEASQPNLLQIFIKAFAFAAAVDIDSSTNKNSFSLRTIAGQEISHDCLFPVQTQVTTTPINSLFIDVSPLLEENSDPSLYLDSFIGGKGFYPVLQALSDRNLSLLTFDDRLPANPMDFARTISFFTIGGRCYQTGWFEKIEDALQKESQERQMPISTLLAWQLINRVQRHHKNEPALLVALMFNASALLLWRGTSYKEDIQKMWRIVFSYLDKIESADPYFFSHALIEHIQMLMRDPDFDFEDLYSQIQISSFIVQNSCHSNEQDVLCETTQTFGHIFTQIKLTLPHLSHLNTLNFFHLFFPYDLSKSIQHLYRSAEKNHSILDSLHEIIAPKSSLAFGFGQSKLKPYRKDKRREFPLCEEGIDRLLRACQQQNRLMGYLLAFSMIAQKKYEKKLKIILKNLLDLLSQEWASVAFKSHLIDLFQSTLNYNQISFNRKTLEAYARERTLASQDSLYVIPNVVYIDLSVELIQTGLDPFVEVGLELLDHLNAIGEFALINLYKRLIKICALPIQLNQEEKQAVYSKSLREIILKLSQERGLSEEIKLRFLLACYAKIDLEAMPEIENRLFESVLLSLQKLDALSIDFLSHHCSEMMKIAMKILQKPIRAQQTFKVLDFAKEIYRLRLVGDWDIERFWDQILSLSPTLPSLSYMYQESCLNLIKEFEYWQKLSQGRRNHFQALFIQNLKACYQDQDETKRASMILRLESSFNSHEHQMQMHGLLDDFLTLQLESWKIKGIPYQDEAHTFVFIEQLARRQDCLKHSLLSEALSEIAKIRASDSYQNEIGRIFKSLYTSQIDQNRHALTDFLFTLANESKTRVQNNSLTLFIYLNALDRGFDSLLALPTEKSLDRFYSQFVAHAQTMNLLNDSAGFFVQTIAKQAPVFLENLHHLQLWQEIIDFCADSPALILKFNLIDTERTLEACQAYLESNTLNLHIFNQFETILEAIPQISLLERHLKAKVGELYGTLAKFSFNRKDYNRTQHWMQKEQAYCDSLNPDFYRRAFDTLKAAAHSGDIGKNDHFLKSFKTPEGYEIKWLSLFRTLLRTNQISSYTSLIQENKSLMRLEEETLKSPG